MAGKRNKKGQFANGHEFSKGGTKGTPRNIAKTLHDLIQTPLVNRLLSVEGSRKFGEAVEEQFDKSPLGFVIKWQQWGLLPRHIDAQVDVTGVTRNDLIESLDRVLCGPKMTIDLSLPKKPTKSPTSPKRSKVNGSGNTSGNGSRTRRGSKSG